MAVNTQFAIAVHIMAAVSVMRDGDAHSCDLASSVNTSPSFVRRILAKLSKADLVETATGKGGCCWLARNPKKISLLDIYKAVDAPKAFAIHSYPARKPCSVSCNFKAALEKVLDKTQRSVEKSLAEVSLAEFMADLKKM